MLGTIRSDINGLVQDCSNSIANALELLQSCTKPSTCHVLSTQHVTPNSKRWYRWDIPNGDTNKKTKDS